MSIKITPALLAELKEKAGNATPEFVREGYFIYGPKHPGSQHPNGRIFITRIVEGSNRRDPNLDGGAWMTGSGTADAEYIAAANPAIVLALIEKIERLEEDFDAAARNAADESVKAVALEEEADWLAKQLTKFDEIPCPEHPCSRSGKNVCLQCWREAARNALDQCKS